jgi:restriction system protein
MIQPYEYFIPLLLKIVFEHKSIALTDAIAIIKDQESYSEEDLRQMTSSPRYPIISHRISWAKTYLKKAGLISQAANRSPMQITENGSLLASQNLQVIDIRYLR